VKAANEEREPDSDTRSRSAVAYGLASRGMSIALEMVVPGLIGYFLDQRLGTRVWLTIGGFGLGFVLGLLHLIRLSKDMNASPPSR